MTENNTTPAWIESKLFENILRENIENFKEIKSFTISNALPPGENYATIMLKIQIEVVVEDGSCLTETFMMKTPHDTELYREQMSKWHMFATEALMYSELVPELEQLYDDAGVKVRFGAKGYKLPIEAKEYVLLEDLKKRGFRNAKRQDCLDMEHCKSVLKKLSQWHAASAVRVERKGPYERKYVQGIAHEAGFQFVHSILQTCAMNALKSAKALKDHEIYYEQMQKMSEKFADIFYETNAVNQSDFNVLNHGDCWSNNIMFQYDDEGHLLETYLVDLQTPHYGSPAQDILYFILSSAKLDFKFERFDEMVKYYYDHLIENLTLLNYSKELPSLGDLHRLLIKAGPWGVFVAWNVLPAVLVDSTEEASIDNLIGDSEESQQFKNLLYTNERIRSQYEKLFPWLYYRGALDMK